MHDEINGHQAGAYSVREFGRVHALSHELVYREIRAGRLIARKVGNRTLITAEDAAHWRASLPRAEMTRKSPIIRSAPPVAEPA
jgi:hypothetical protein